MKLYTKKDFLKLNANTTEVAYFKEVITNTLCLKNLKELKIILDKTLKILER